MKSPVVPITLSMLILLMMCRPPKPKEKFDYGRIENNRYSNEFFGCSIEIPSDWIVQSREQTEKIKDIGKEMIAGDDRKLKKEIKASDIRSVNLLTVFKYELGTTTEFNPNISVVSENVRYSPNIKTGEDYLNHSRKILGQSQFKYDSVSTNFDKVDFSGKVFSKMYTSVNYMGIPIQQEYFSCIINGFSFNIVISYTNDIQKGELQEVLGSLEFE